MFRIYTHLTLRPCYRGVYAFLVRFIQQAKKKRHIIIVTHHDINYLNDIRLLYHDCSIFGDNGYIGAEIQLDLFETANIRLECPYRLNQKNWKPTFISFAKARKMVETLFSQFTDQFFVIRNYAKETCVLFARIVSKVSAMTSMQYINYLINKPIDRIKYALI